MSRALSILFAIAVLIGLVPTASPAPAYARDPAAAGQAQLERDVEAIVASGVSGVQARVTGTDGRHVVDTAGVADLRTGAPVSPRSHYRIGSNTKTFVATVVLQLVGEGRLSLDDTVEQWLPGQVQGNGNDGGQITIRQLLQHTSGLTNYTINIAPVLGTAELFRRNRFRGYRPDRLLSWALAYEPQFLPGRGWGYSNTNYLVASMIIEQVTGRRWEREVTDRIIKPLGLKHTIVRRNRPTLPRPHAKGYTQFGPGQPLVDTTVYNPSWLGAAGSIISTTEDVDRFFRALLDGELLEPAQLAEMTDTVPAGDDRYGLGLRWRDDLSCDIGYWSHTGDTLGFVSREAFIPDGESVVVSASSVSLDWDGEGERQEAAIKQLIDHALCDEEL